LFKHTDHPDIPKIKRVNVGGKRRYETPTGIYVSITTLLHSLPSSPGLAEWRERVGEDVANHMMTSGAIRGTRLHNAVEAYLSNKPMQNIKQEYGVTAAGLFELMQPELDHIDNIRAIEEQIYSAKLEIAGTTDCVAEFDGMLSIIDFKSSTWMKDEESIRDYLIQATFYSVAWEELTGQKIEQIVIIMASEDGMVKVFKSKPTEHMEKLKEAIEEYKRQL
jgi:genome maintenance exonuclease 1